MKFNRMRKANIKRKLIAILVLFIISIAVYYLYLWLSFYFNTVSADKLLPKIERKYKIIPPLISRFYKNTNCTEYINNFDTLFANKVANKNNILDICRKGYTYLVSLVAFCNSTPSNRALLNYYYSCKGLYTGTDIANAAVILSLNTSKNVREDICTDLLNYNFSNIIYDPGLLMFTSLFIVCEKCNFQRCLDELCNLSKTLNTSNKTLANIGRIRLTAILNACVSMKK